MSPNKLVHMANQIATFFASQPREDQAERVAGHLRDFWDPRMRAELMQILDSGGAGLNTLAAAAVERLSDTA
jgi:formate dehydrogenase subunit delta